QGGDGVGFGVGPRGAPVGGEGAPAQPLAHARGLPHRPQDGADAAGAAGRLEQRREPFGRGGPLLVGEDGDRAGGGEGLDEEVGGGGEVVGGHGDAAQLLAQPPFGEGVGAAERGGQEAGRGGLVEPLDAPSDEDDVP